MVIVENMIKTECVDNVRYDYYYRVIKGQVNVGENLSTSIQSYGIEIERQDFQEDVLINVERERIDNISPHRHKVQNLVKVLYNGGVSPIHLVDILSETVDNYIVDYDEVLEVTSFC